MPIDMAVEKPGPGIIGDEPEGGRLHRQQLDCVTAEWVRLSLPQRRVELGVTRSVVIATVDDLKLVTVDVAML